MALQVPWHTGDTSSNVHPSPCREWLLNRHGPPTLTRSTVIMEGSRRRPSSSLRLYPSGLLSRSLTFHSFTVLSGRGERRASWWLLPEPPADGHAKATRAGKIPCVPQCHVLEAVIDVPVPTASCCCTALQRSKDVQGTLALDTPQQTRQGVCSSPRVMLTFPIQNCAEPSTHQD